MGDRYTEQGDQMRQRVAIMRYVDHQDDTAGGGDARRGKSTVASRSAVRAVALCK
jgi:hypothetical protein